MLKKSSNFFIGGLSIDTQQIRERQWALIIQGCIDRELYVYEYCKPKSLI